MSDYQVGDTVYKYRFPWWEEKPSLMTYKITKITPCFLYFKDQLQRESRVNKTVPNFDFFPTIEEAWKYMVKVKENRVAFFQKELDEAIQMKQLAIDEGKKNGFVA